VRKGLPGPGADWPEGVASFLCPARRPWPSGSARPELQEAPRQRVTKGRNRRQVVGPHRPFAQPAPSIRSSFPRRLPSRRRLSFFYLCFSPPPPSISSSQLSIFSSSSSPSPHLSPIPPFLLLHLLLSHLFRWSLPKIPNLPFLSSHSSWLHPGVASLQESLRWSVCPDINRLVPFGKEHLSRRRHPNLPLVVSPDSTGLKHAYAAASSTSTTVQLCRASDHRL
jgi:hypothetical protein